MLPNTPYLLVRPRLITGGDFITGITHRWPMTDAQVSGLTVNDVVGSDPGTSSASGISSAAGPNGTYPQGRAFDGASGTNIAGSSSPFDWNSGSFTVATWLWITNNAAASGGGSAQRYYVDDIAGDGSKYLQILNLSGGGIRVTTSQGQINSTGTPVTSGTWTHLVFTNSGGGSGGTKALYIAGSLIGSSTASGNDSFNAATSCQFGNGNVTASDGQLTGRLANFRVYGGRALLAADVAALFAAGG